MSATLKTLHYNIPKYAESDAFNPLTGENVAADIIDVQMYANETAAAKNATDIAGLVAEDTTIKGSVAQVSDRVSAIEAKVPGYDAIVSADPELVAKVDANTASIEGLDTRTTNLETNVNNLQTEDASLDARLTAVEADVENIPDVSQIQADIDGLKVDNAAQIFKEFPLAATNFLSCNTSGTVTGQNIFAISNYVKLVANNSAVLGLTIIDRSYLAYAKTIAGLSLRVTGNPFALAANTEKVLGGRFAGYKNDEYDINTSFAFEYARAVYNQTNNYTDIKFYSSTNHNLPADSWYNLYMVLLPYAIPQGD